MHTIAQPMSDFDLIISWNVASKIFDDASKALSSVRGNFKATEACQKAMMAATEEMVFLGKEASNRRLLITRRTSG